MIFFYLFSLIILVFYIFSVVKRAKKYKYNQKQDYIYSLNKNIIETAIINNNLLKLNQEYKEYDSLFAKIELSFNLLSYFFKPYIEIEDVKHYFEYGAKGIRYLNISHLENINITLKPKNIKLSNKEISIYGYNNHIDLSKKILILAPHADDAEIAAFGLYKTAENVTIITTTAGEHGMCNYCDIYNNDRTKQSLKKAELRVFDALCVPLLGNVEIQNSLTLGYFGGSLKWMSEHKNETASSFIAGINNMNLFRKVSHANLNLSLNVKPTYTDFLNDIKSIIEQVQPGIIITPHPSIDSHPDHKYTTLVLFEALKSIKHKCKLLLYTNHLKLSETYPIGEMNSAITIPPNLEEFYFDSIYSFNLDEDLQIDKFFALEAIHDLRDSLTQISISKSYKHFSKLLKRRLFGKDKSYYKRAVRTNELFFVVEDENINRLTEI